MDTIFNWLLSKAKDYLVRNWQTTLIGVLGAILTQIPALAPQKDAIVAGVLALLGIFSKAATTTGTTDQPRTDPAVVQAQNEAVKSGGSVTVTIQPGVPGDAG